MAVTFPAPSDGGAYDYEGDYTDAFAADSTTIQSYSGSPWMFNSGSSSHWVYLAADDGFRNNNSIVSFYSCEVGTTGDWDDVEIVALVTVADWTGSGDHVVIAGRNESDAASGMGIRWGQAADQWRMYDRADNTGKGPTSTAVVPTDGDAVWHRLFISGTAIKSKCWVLGDDEPADWQIETTDTLNSTGFPALLGSVGSPPVGGVVLHAFAFQADPSEAVATAELAASSTSSGTATGAGTAVVELASTSTTGATATGGGTAVAELASTSTAGLTAAGAGTAVAELAAVSTSSGTAAATGAGTVELSAATTAGATATADGGIAGAVLLAAVSTSTARATAAGVASTPGTTTFAGAMRIIALHAQKQRQAARRGPDRHSCGRRWDQRDGRLYCGWCGLFGPR